MSCTARTPRDDGFTWLEMLVVMLIIGILAAVALPVFLRHEGAGRDTVAKGLARNALSQVEACFAEEQDYARCGASSARMSAAATGIRFVSGAPSVGQVQLTRLGRMTYAINARSGSDNVLTIAKDESGTVTRTCRTAGADACPRNGRW